MCGGRERILRTGGGDRGKKWKYLFSSALSNASSREVTGRESQIGPEDYEQGGIGGLEFPALGTHCRSYSSYTKKKMENLPKIEKGGVGSLVDGVIIRPWVLLMGGGGEKKRQSGSAREENGSMTASTPPLRG